MENETDVVSGVSTLAMAVDQAGPLSFADILDLGAEVAGRLADQHDDGQAHGHVAPGAVVRLDDGPWRLAPAELIPDIEPVPAPELGPDAEPTAAADVYALGATLSFGLTGVPVEPVDATDPTAAAAEGDPLLDEPIDLDLTPVPDGPRTIADLAAIDRTDEPGPVSASTSEPEAGSEVASEPSSEPSSEPPSEPPSEPSSEPEAAPMTLPEVMSSFLVTLRATLAADPSARPSAPDLAATLRQLRSDADSALGGALVGGAAAAGAVAAVAIGDGAAAEPWGAPLYDTSSVEATADPPEPGALAVEGTGSGASLAAVGASAKKKKSLKERVPVIVATAAVLLAAVLGVSLVRERNDRTSDVLAAGPTVGTQVRRSTTTTMPVIVLEVPLESTTTMVTSSSTVTTTTAPEVVDTVPDTTAPTTAPSTTLPPTTLPPTTLPPTTTTQPGVPFKLAKVACATPPNPANPCALFAAPDATSEVRSGPLPNGVNLQATCTTKGAPPTPGGLDTWLYIIGPPPSYSGWLSATHLGGSIPTVPPCAANQAP